MKSIILTIAFLLAITGTQSAWAQDIDKGHVPLKAHRQRHQMHRINRGRSSGQLTKGEETRLKGQQEKIEADKNAAKADGKVTKGEKKHLDREQNKADADIYKAKHNDKVAK